MPVMQGTFGKYCRMHLRPWKNERHQTPKSDLLIFRFAAAILYVEWAGPDTAKALRIDVPPTLLARVNEMIE